MLKFTEFTEENIESVATELFDSDEYAKEVLTSFDFFDEDVSFAAAYSDACILIRIFDFGRYLFLYPIEMNDTADPKSALMKIAEYAMREEIGLSFADVPRECVDTFFDLGFSHLEIDRVDEDSYRIRIKTECELSSGELYICEEKIALAEIKEADMSAYAALVLDDDLNKFWGYNYKDDNPNSTETSIFEDIKRGRDFGSAITLGVFNDNKLVGSVELFAFSGFGTCEFAVRIAKEYQGQGYGSLATEAVIKLAKTLGIKKLSCDVLNENEKSIALMQKYFTEKKSKTPDRRHFERII